MFTLNVYKTAEKSSLATLPHGIPMFTINLSGGVCMSKKTGVISVRFPDNHPIFAHPIRQRGNKIRELVDIALKIENLSKKFECLDEILKRLVKIESILSGGIVVNQKPQNTEENQILEKTKSKVLIDVDAFANI